MKNLTFTPDGDSFIAEIVLQGDTAIEMHYATDVPVINISLEQSISGTNWKKFFNIQHDDTYFTVNVLGVVPSTRLRVICDKNPTLAYYV